MLFRGRNMCSKEGKQETRWRCFWARGSSCLKQNKSLKSGRCRWRHELLEIHEKNLLWGARLYVSVYLQTPIWELHLTPACKCRSICSVREVFPECSLKHVKIEPNKHILVFNEESSAEPFSNGVSMLKPFLYKNMLNLQKASFLLYRCI